MNISSGIAYRCVASAWLRVRGSGPGPRGSSLSAVSSESRVPSPESRKYPSATALSSSAAFAPPRAYPYPGRSMRYRSQRPGPPPSTVSRYTFARRVLPGAALVRAT